MSKNRAKYRSRYYISDQDSEVPSYGNYAIGRISVFIVIACLIMCVSGCGASDHNVTIEYKPVSISSIQRFQETHTIHLEITDAIYRDSKVPRNGLRAYSWSAEHGDSKVPIGDYCYGLSWLYAKNDILQLVSDAMQAEFNHRGYTLDPHGVRVNIEIDRFYVKSPCKYSLESNATVAFVIRVIDPQGNSLYSNNAVGTYQREPGFWSFSWGWPTDGRVALEHALSLVINKVVTDQLLYEAIEKTANQEKQP
jgi:YajG family uncharacterized lipoprotein